MPQLSLMFSNSHGLKLCRKVPGDITKRAEQEIPSTQGTYLVSCRLCKTIYSRILSALAVMVRSNGTRAHPARDEKARYYVGQWASGAHSALLATCARGPTVSFCSSDAKKERLAEPNTFTAASLSESCRGRPSPTILIRSAGPSHPHATYRTGQYRGCTGSSYRAI